MNVPLPERHDELPWLLDSIPSQEHHMSDDERWMTACIAMAKVLWGEYPESSVSAIARIWGDAISADEVAALEWLEQQAEFDAARQKIWD